MGAKASPAAGPAAERGQPASHSRGASSSWSPCSSQQSPMSPPLSETMKPSKGLPGATQRQARPGLGEAGRWAGGGGALTKVVQEAQSTRVLRQSTQALDPAAAHCGRRPGRSAQGACLSEESRQQLPLLEWRRDSDRARLPGTGSPEILCHCGCSRGSFWHAADVPRGHCAPGKWLEAPCATF